MHEPGRDKCDDRLQLLLTYVCAAALPSARIHHSAVQMWAEAFCSMVRDMSAGAITTGLSNNCFRNLTCQTLPSQLAKYNIEKSNFAKA